MLETTWKKTLAVVIQEYRRIRNFSIHLNNNCLNNLRKINFYEHLRPEMDTTLKITNDMTFSAIFQFANF